MDTNEGLRKRGPGKFSTELDAYLYEVSLSGCDMEDSDEGWGWVGLLKGPSFTYFIDGDPLQERLTEEERNYLSENADGGVVLRETTDGFVFVSYYRDHEEAMSAFDDLVSEFAPEEETEEPL